MELLQLKYFCDAAETENFTRTAKKYTVPASNISQSVHRLEKELGINLFDRSANKIKLSEQGKIFYNDIKRALILIDESKRKISAPDALSGEIRILIETNRRVSTRAIESFKKEYSDVTFLINHNANLNDRSYDFIVSADEEGYNDFSKQLLVSEKIVAAVPKMNPLSKMKKIAPQKLCNEKFISMHEKSSMYSVARKICHDAGFAPNIVIQSDDPFYVRKYVEMGLGIALIPEFSWRGMFSPDVTLIDIGNYKRDTYVYYSKYLTTVRQLFLDMLIKTFDK